MVGGREQDYKFICFQHLEILFILENVEIAQTGCPHKLRPEVRKLAFSLLYL